MGTQAPRRGPTGHTMRSALGGSVAWDVHRGVDVERGDQRLLCDADESGAAECYVFLQCVPFDFDLFKYNSSVRWG